MNSVKIGHYTDSMNKTGLSVLLFEPSAVASYHLCGAAPATREIAPLEPENSVSVIHGLMLGGGSALALGAADGVMQYLIEQKIGLQVPHGIVPIVPSACVYDLAYGRAVAAKAEHAYQACKAATINNETHGRIGAGTGATVGKLPPAVYGMTGGFGHARITLAPDIDVAVYVVVNAVGDIFNQRGEIVAGAKNAQQQFLHTTHTMLQQRQTTPIFAEFSHTTLAVVTTNAKFNKAELKHIAKMTSAGMARAINPVFTGYDGDIIFAVSSGEKKAAPSQVGIAAAEALHLAILNAVDQSETLKL